MTHTWRDIAEIWANNLSGENKDWIPVGSHNLANALLEARDEVAQLEERVRELEADNAELRESLNQVTDNRWTAMEIDAAKWRGQEMAKALEGKS